MQTEIFQVERAPVGSESWEQMAPALNTQELAHDLMRARMTENLYSSTKYQFRVVCTRRIVLQHP
jgi:hypothetical protein